nr:hypothetical protein [Tanacetum cinerariifolium]
MLVSLWVNWVNLVKLKGKSVWEINVDVSNSGTWKAIVNLRSKIRNNVWKEIGDGKKTNVWYDKWNYIGLLNEFIPFKKRYEARLSEQMDVADLIDNGNWIWPNDRRNHFHKLGNMNIPDLIEGKKDRVIWTGNNGKKDKFSINSVWEIFKANRNNVSWHKVVWYPQCNPRHTFILQLSLHGRLATQDRLMVWNNQNNLMCPLCKIENDSHKHRFFKCSYSEDIWKNVIEKVKERYWDKNRRTVVNLLANGRCNNTIKSVLHKMAISTDVYFIWNERNQIIFLQNQRNSQCLLNGIVENIKLQPMSLKVRKSGAMAQISKDCDIQMNIV